LGDDGHERVVAAGALHIGDHVAIRPGERISADGVIVAGSSDVDQSSITGEPLPVRKSVGDEVFAGTLNGSGALRATVTRDPSQTVVARIVAMVAEASATKAKTQLFIEKVEQRYSVVVVAATLALFAVPMALGADLQSTLLRARARRIVIANLAIAACVIGVHVSWDLFGELPLPLGVAGHEGSTILVALNGLQLLGNRAWRTAANE
jgi:cation-transporting P-type ATPase D